MKNIKTLEQCKDEVAQSYFYDNYKHYLTEPATSAHDDWEFHLKIVDDAAEIYANQFKPEWVSVEDKEPEIDQMVIGYRPLAHTYGDETITMLKFKGYENEDANGVIHKFERYHHVTHWMPLPEKPQK